MWLCVFSFFSLSLLLQFFNFYTFKLEETVYAQEKIDFKHVSYIDNQPVLDLIEMKPKVKRRRHSSSRAGALQ